MIFRLQPYFIFRWCCTLPAVFLISASCHRHSAVNSEAHYLEGSKRQAEKAEHHDGAESDPVRSVLTTESRGDFEDVYSWKAGDCSITWHIYKGINEGVARFRFNAKPVTDTCLPNLGNTLDQLRAMYQGRLPFQTLAQGRLIQAGGLGPQEMSRNLVLAAIRSSGWDIFKGLPINAEINDFVRNLGNDSDVHNKYRKEFAAHGLLLEISGVEKVLVARVRDLPFSIDREADTIDWNALVPYDALIWFSSSSE